MRHNQSIPALVSAMCMLILLLEDETLLLSYIYIYIYIYRYMGVNNGKDQRMWRKLKNKVIRSEEFNMKESRRYNVSVSINHH